MTEETGDLKTIHVVGAAILQGNKCLVAQRGPGMSLEGKWEFPGGKPEDGETPEAALARELLEELLATATIGAWVGRGESQVGEKRIVLDVYLAEIKNVSDCTSSDQLGQSAAPANGHIP